jgi:IstB-like ATP binding protein
MGIAVSDAEPPFRRDSLNWRQEGGSPFSSWTKTFTDPRLCAAIVDRLTFAGHIVETGSTSYRLAHIRNVRPAS